MESTSGGPIKEGWINPGNSDQLLRYFFDVNDWHGYVKTIGLPQLQDNPDVPLEAMYVESRLADRYCDPGRVDSWPSTMSIIDALKSRDTLVILGDPGSGKSTLVSYLAYAFSRHTPNRYKDELGWLVPLPFVLREMKIGPSPTLADLIDVFLRHPVAAKLDRELVRGLIQRGQALILVDGLDELPDNSAKAAVTRALLDLAITGPDSKVLVTSRIVGYEEEPVIDGRFGLSREIFRNERMRTRSDWVWDREQARQSIDQVYESIRASRHVAKVAASIKDRMKNLESSQGEPAESNSQEPVNKFVMSPLYVVPFDDGQILQFSGNWHLARIGNPVESAQRSEDFVRRVKSTPDIQRLARIPNLLTMMAIVHRVRLNLPHGRALLYSEISQVYLESLDAVRNLQQRYTLAQAKQWLAWVGWKMQLRRTERNTEGEDEAGAILVGGDELTAWLVEAMQVSGTPPQEAESFVDYICRRSGLLLPRGKLKNKDESEADNYKDYFAFAHLSFQEYFAAVYLASKLSGRDYLKFNKDIGGLSSEQVTALADDVRWHQTIALAFELVDEGWIGEIFERLFPDSETKSPPQHVARLLADLAADPHSALGMEERRAAWSRVWRWWLDGHEEAAKDHVYPSDIVGNWLGACVSGLEPLVREPAWEEWERSVANRPAVDWVNLVGFGHNAGRLVSNWPACKEGVSIEVDDVAAIVSGLAEATVSDRVAGLNVVDEGLSDLSPLSGLSSLQTLWVSSTQVSDLSPLSSLSSLQELWLSGTQVSDFTPLLGLTSLRELWIRGKQASETGISELRKALPNCHITVW